METALIGLGSNCPAGGQTPSDIIRQAVCALGSIGKVKAVSPLYKSAAWPDPTQPEYVNAVALIQTRESPRATLAGLLAIEAAFGRIRSDDPALRYAPRSLDLDLLDHGGMCLDEPGLALPHPRMQERAFVMGPLADIWPDWPHPKTGQLAKDIAGRLEEPGTAPLEGS